MRPTLLLLILGLLGACAPKHKGEVLEKPGWTSEREQVQIRLDIVEALLEQGRSDAALLILARLGEDGVKDPHLVLYQGKALHLQGMSTEAEQLYLQAAAKMGRSPEPLQELGVLYADTGRIPEAMTLFEQALELEEDASTWNNLGVLLHSQQRHADAVSALQRAVALDGTQARYRNNLGFSLAAQGRYDEALASFMSLGAPADAHANLATAMELTGDPFGAALHYTRALEYDPAQATAQEAAERLEIDIEEVP